ncbi:MAG: RNA methyltransferase [Bacteroidota bacterium]
MLSQNQVKHISALRVKKYREEFSQFIAEGHKLVTELMNSDFSVAGIYASSEWIVANLPLVRERNIPVFETLPREMERITALATPSPVLAVVEIGPVSDPVADGNGSLKGLNLALDDIRDPGNMGTIIRIADWFGISAVFCSPSCVELFNPKVVQATMGSIARVRMVSCNLAELLASQSARHDDFPIYGAFLEGESLYAQPLADCGIILIGNESRGISAELGRFVNRKIYIPSFGPSDAGKAESLNASVAAAIICAEFRRKTF